MGFVKIVKNKNEIIEYLKMCEVVNTGEFFEKNNEIGKIIEELYNQMKRKRGKIDDDREKGIRTYQWKRTMEIFF